MAMIAYLKLKSTKNTYPGTCGQNPDGTDIKAGTHHRVLGVKYGVKSPLNANTGRPSNQRFHDPLTLLMEVNKCTPMYFEDLTRLRTFPEVEVTFIRQKGGKDMTTGSGPGGFEVAMLFKLQQAHLLSFRYITGTDQREWGGGNTTLGGVERAQYDTLDLFEVQFHALKFEVRTGSPDGNVGYCDDCTKPAA